MASRDFLLPDLGEGLEDAEVVAWHVAVGQAVCVDDPLLEVETAKANVEIPSPFTGTVVALHAEPGARVAVGAPLVTMDVAGADASPAAPAGRGRAPARPLVGYGPSEGAAGATRGARVGGARTSPSPAPPAARVLATPPARRRARELGIDLATVPGSGPDGAITTTDLDRMVGGATPAADEPPTVGKRVPVRGVRRVVAERLAESRRIIPDASSWVDCDATELLSLRSAINDRHRDADVTPLALVMRACVAGLGRFPALNARYHDDSLEIEYLDAVHLGFAAQTDRGLVVPVIHDAHARTTLELAAELRRLAGAAREGSISPRELAGSTFTVSNYGAFGVDGGVAIINHPDAAILGVGRFTERPWVVDGTLAIRTVVQLSLSFDHRIMDGGDAGGFLRFVADCVEEPATLVAEL
ncbi:MAG TPA: dihydrolipoamide acetyltransferase family protein [Acidimicrobiia bacterium]